MTKISTILIPFDFSKASKEALDYAVNYVGDDDKLKIVLVHVSNGKKNDEDETTFKNLEKKYREVLKNKIELISVNGNLTEEIIKFQKKEAIDLIIMGTAGNNDIHSSNTSKLVLEADCSVMVVPSELGEFRLKNIGLVLGKEVIDDKKVLGTLLEVSRRFNAKVHVITIKNKPEMFGYSEIDEKNENTIQYYLEDFYSQHVFIENPDVVEGILNFAAERDIDLITILPRNHTKNSDPSEGKLTELLTLHSSIPILAID